MANSLIGVRVANLVMLIGFVIVVIGAVMRFAPGVFGWFGNLPGDIKIDGETSRIYIPVTSMIIVSVVLTLLINVLARIARDG